MSEGLAQCIARCRVTGDAGHSLEDHVQHYRSGHMEYRVTADMIGECQRVNEKTV
jgi:hypothetical protein